MVKHHQYSNGRGYRRYGQGYGYDNHGYGHQYGYHKYGRKDKYSSRGNYGGNYRSEIQQEFYLGPLHSSKQSLNKLETYLSENPSSLPLFRRHRHIVQCFQYEGGIQEAQPGDFKRVLDHGSAPTTEYHRRRGHYKSVVHWGQRKLLLSEIEFLTVYGHLGKTVIYAGAADGRHIQLLSEMFPSHRFLLIDPAPNGWQVSGSEQICINPMTDTGFFTNELALQFGKEYKDILFISDIRTAEWKDTEEEEIETQVVADQNAQAEWVKIMQPKAAMLKFRLPYTKQVNEKMDEDMSYLAGEIYLPVWGPVTTSETRLIVTDPNQVKKYNRVKYDYEMFYFNTTLRTRMFKHQLLNTGDVELDAKVAELGIDCCYDCAAEVHVMNEYLLQKQNAQCSPKELCSWIEKIDCACSATRKLKHGPKKTGDHISEWEKEASRQKSEFLKSVDTKSGMKKK